VGQALGGKVRVGDDDRIGVPHGVQLREQLPREDRVYPTEHLLPLPREIDFTPWYGRKFRAVNRPLLQNDHAY
jgi:hypothetical protein